MAADEWNWKHPVELQDVPWDCAAASLSWALQAAGIPLSEAEVVSGLGPARISPVYGLLDSSGAGIVEYLAEIGIAGFNNPDATWEEVETAAGFQPMVVGGRGWNHWTGVRMGNSCFRGTPGELLLLANPAPGYMNVWQELARWQFDELGSFSAVWFLV